MKLLSIGKKNTFISKQYAGNSLISVKNVKKNNIHVKYLKIKSKNNKIFKILILKFV